MSDLLHIVKGLSVQPKCILMLGARTEAMLSWLFSLTASKVVLVEPEPAMFEKATALHNAKGNPENVIVKHGVPAFETVQKATRYFVSDVPGYSSVLPPNVIKDIRSALEFTEKEAPVIDLKPLLQQLDISEGSSCLLITQLNGGEQQCLNSQLLDVFTHVVIQSSTKPVFGETKPLENLKSKFFNCGRDYLRLAEPIPPYLNLLTTRKVNTVQALNYFNQRQQHREIKVALESQLSSIQSEARRVADELQQAKLQAEQKQKRLGDELQQVKEQLQTTKQQMEEKDKQKIKLTQDFAQLKNEKEQQLESFKAQLEKASESENRHLKAVEITSKLNLKLQLDLDDLRLRFADKVKAEKELNELISELYVKLRQAANFYYQLEEKYPELTDLADE